MMVLITLLWSSAGVVTRHLDAARSFEITFWRSAATVVALTVMLPALGGVNFWQNLRRPTTKVWVSGLCWSVMFSAFMIALALTSVANVLIIMALGPLLTALAARIFLNHRLLPVTWGAIVVAGLGIVWMFARGDNASVSLAGSCVALVVPLGAAVNFTILQSVGLRQDPSPVSGTEPGDDMQSALLIGAVISAAATLPLAWPLQASLHDIQLLSLLGIFQLAVPCLLVIRLSKVLPAPEITLLSLLEVLFGVTWAWLWAAETPSTHTLAGGLLVIGALAVNALARVVHERKKVL